MYHSRQKVPYLMAALCLFVALQLFACSGKQSTSEGGIPDASTACTSHGDCSAGTSCRDNRCLPDDDSDAGPSEKKSECEPGTAACRCTVTGKCQEGLRCEDSVCQVCNEGTAGCACKGGKSCNSGLRCESGLCQGCVGKANCPCYGTGHCDKGHKCQLSDSGASTCHACKAGEPGCNCEKDSDCGGALLCANKRCMEPAKANLIPKNPRCYSPCESDVKMPDGTLRSCHPEHKLMEGCPVGQACVEGSCLSPKQAQNLNSSSYPYCATDANCPSWQACVEGRCYSTCRSSSECPNGFSCHSYVCRRECNVRTKACANTYSCATKGSDDGICMPKANNYNPNPVQQTTTGTFAVSFRNLAFTKVLHSQELFLTNSSKYSVDFTIHRSKDSLGSKAPLSWLKFDLCKTYSSDGKTCKAFMGKPSSAEPFEIKQVPANKLIIIKVSNATGKPASAKLYQGTLQVKGDRLDAKEVNVDYREKVDGQWRGTMVAFGNFDDTEISKLQDSSVDIRSLKNAFLRRWINFKRSEIDRDKFIALMRSIKEGSWKLKKVQEDCKRLFSAVASPDVACYPYSSSKGYEILSQSQREAPVPSGSSELSFVVNLKESSSTALIGRIETSQTLQYPGNPEIQLSFGGSVGGQKVFLKSMNATIDVGGRYYVSDTKGCKDGANFVKSTLPWLVPGFELMSYARSSGLFRDRFECRSKTIPRSVPAGASDKEKAAIQEYNTSLSGSNPIPNGWRLRRKLELVDGVMLDGQYMFILYKERFVSFFNNSARKQSALDNDFVNYGYMFLRRGSSELKSEDYVGSKASTLKSCTADNSCSAGQVCRGGICRPASELSQVSCSPEIVKAAVNRTISAHLSLQAWSGTLLEGLVSALMGNQSTAANKPNMQIARTENNGQVEYSYTRDGKKYYIHYFCEDNKQLNGGTTDDPKDCPASSKVIFFESTLSEDDMRSHSCQTATDPSKTCDQRLAQLRTTPGFREGVPYTCADANKVFCDANRKDLREGKIFFKPSSGNTFVSSMSPLRHALFEAFRYRIKFQSRTGKNVGFTPSLCSKVASSQTPYCYNPQVIERLEQRVNCLEALYADSTLSNKLSKTTKAVLKSYLSQAFSFRNRLVNGVLFTDPGFETLNAELKVMLGDEAYTRSFASRYDLANTNLVSFQGSLHEPNGIDVSGALGYEMYNLYLSTQYYQMVLDRFFSTANLLHQSFADSGSNFVSADAVTSYFQKLLLASTRKARSWSQIAKRYHQLNRPDLARHVVERAYSSTFMEMTILTRLLRELMGVVDRNQIAQLTGEIDKVALTYKSSLLDMQETYKKLSLSMDHFGFQAGYIPFPAMDSFCAITGSCNAFTVAFRFAQEKLAIAKNKEQVALETKRSFDTSAASFQSELVRIEQNYESQLSAICGNLEVKDANGQKRLVPAIPKYAQLSDKTRSIGDPCGLVQGSSIYESLVRLDKLRLNIASLRQQQQDILAKIQLEKERIKKFCDDQFALKQITWDAQGETKNLELEVLELQGHIQRAERIGHALIQVAELVKCTTVIAVEPSTGFSGGDCPTAIKSAALILVVSGLTEGLATYAQGIMQKKQRELLDVQRALQTTQLQFSCKACDVSDSTCQKSGTAQLESKTRIKELTASLVNLNYETLRFQYALQTAVSDLTRQRQQAKRLMTQLDETTQLAINVQAAQNDPNTRIYKNDAILSAERTFNEAMREAYRTTLIYEYYTGQSYAKKGELYLIRMISAGDKNLEAYLSQLEQAFREFEEQNGKPDIRVLVLSLMNDILKVDRTDPNGKARDLNDRIAEFQKMLTDRDRLNRDGYTAIPFGLSVAKGQSRVSPVTFNHKILYVEAEIVSTSKGDDVARLYLRQKGTSMVRLSDGQLNYYPLPQITAVLNPFFNGSKVFDPRVYKNFRLRDRPLGNTQWELLINQVSEKANQDIDLNSVSDITLYIYYTDFTKEN